MISKQCNKMFLSRKCIVFCSLMHGLFKVKRKLLIILTKSKFTGIFISSTSRSLSNLCSKKILLKKT